LDVNDFKFNDSPDDYYLHFGLLVEHKGAHISIDACRRLGLKLKVAGEDQFFEEKKRNYAAGVKASCDGKDIEYIGAVDTGTKNRLISGARAVLLPFLQDEMYSLILIESLLHGTPVVVFPMGAIPEMVNDKVAVIPPVVMTDRGRSLDTERYDKFPELVGKIDRAECRRFAESKFGIDRTADAYVSLYDKVRGGNKW
jgi:glycosyltransferase involved in cell wall biosynthesis